MALAIGGPIAGRNIIAWSHWIDIPVYDLATSKAERHRYEHISDILLYVGVIEYATQP